MAARSSSKRRRALTLRAAVRLLASPRGWLQRLAGRPDRGYGAEGGREVPALRLERSNENAPAIAGAFVASLWLDGWKRKRLLDELPHFLSADLSGEETHGGKRRPHGCGE